MKFFKTISSFLLIGLVLFSSTSFMVGMHICMGETQDVAFLAKAQACELERNLPPCHKAQKMACCEDKTIVHEGEDEQMANPQVHIPACFSVELEQPQIFIAEVVPASAGNSFQYFNYDPPLRAVDLTVEHRVFLI